MKNKDWEQNKGSYYITVSERNSKTIRSNGVWYFWKIMIPNLVVTVYVEKMGAVSNTDWIVCHNCGDKYSWLPRPIRDAITISGIHAYLW